MKRLFNTLGKARTANWLLLVGFLIFILGISIFFWQQSILHFDQQIDSSILGNLGSFLSGTVGTLWSLASVLYFILALREQRKDIKDNRKGQDLQRFETTFFQLLQIHSNTVRDLTFGEDDKKLEGRKIFRYWKNYLNIIAKAEQRQIKIDGNRIIEKRNDFAETNEEFENFLNDKYFAEYYNIFEGSLNHYFRQLYHIFKYIHRTPLIKDENRKFYTSLLRAQLSQDELYSIAVNGLIDGYGYPNFLFLIKEYDLLKNFNYKAIPQGMMWNYIMFKMDTVKDPFKKWP